MFLSDTCNELHNIKKEIKYLLNKKRLALDPRDQLDCDAKIKQHTQSVHTLLIRFHNQKDMHTKKELQFIHGMLDFLHSIYDNTATKPPT